MERPRLLVSLFELPVLARTRCLSCQFNVWQSRQLSRQISGSSRSLQKQSATQPTKGNSSSDDDEYKPFQLKQPVGLAKPPQEGENAGKSKRTLRERFEDMFDKEKHQQRRVEIAKDFTKPYFRDSLRTRYHHGKTFISNPRLFKAKSALYFPNLYGRTLRKDEPLQDSTPTLRGKISVVSVFTTMWAERQTASFVGNKENPQLHKLIEGSGSAAQRVELNIEQNWLKSWIVRNSMGGIRRQYPKEQHGRYFLVTKGFSEALKQQIGMLNGVVGYVYLLDDTCRIRWAGSALAQPDELTALNNGLRKLIDEKKAEKTSTVAQRSSPNQKSAQQKKPSVVVT